MEHIKKKPKLMDIDDLEAHRDWLSCLAGYIEWDYPLSYQHDIDRVIHLLNEMIEKEKAYDR